MAGHLHVVSKAEQPFSDDAVFAAERTKGKTLFGPEKKRCAVLPVNSCWGSVKLKPLNRHVLKNVRLQNSPGTSLSLFVVNR